MIGGIALARPRRSWSEIGVQAKPVWLQRVHVGACGQSVTFCADVRDIQQNLAAHGSLETQGPVL